MLSHIQGLAVQPVFREAFELSQKGEPFTIAAVVRTKGSTPQKLGAKLLIRMAELIQFRLGRHGQVREAAGETARARLQQGVEIAGQGGCYSRLGGVGCL